MRTYKIAVLPGDGIGREVIEESIKVLEALQEKINGISLELDRYDCGARFWLENNKEYELSPEAFEFCKTEADAIFFGAVGWTDENGKTVSYPDGRMVGIDTLFKLRFELDLYANIRPTKLFEGVPHQISGKIKQIWKPENVDFVTIRENTEDLYANMHGYLRRKEETEVATDIMIATRKGVERIVKYAFEYCKSRNKGAPKDKQLRVSCVDKENVLASSKLFRSIFREISSNYPAINSNYYYVDAFTLLMMQNPENLDVVVSQNMFGDIITDLAALLQGGMGMAPSGEVGEKNALFEPVHGSAPSIADKKIANPIAAILTAELMLKWLADKRNDKNLDVAANLVESAVISVLKDGKIRTQDLGGNSRTDEMTDAILSFIKEE